jgi:alpha-N-arabinofuranosidase
MTNQLTIHVGAGQSTISRHIYGHFAEHLGHCIYGGIWVGEDSTIPNTRGIRNDVVQALRAIHIPNLRWPGGCFADEYHWMDGIGPKEQRPTMVNTHWGGVTENNHFGTHEFMDLCDQLGCEPYICGNVGSGTVHEMQQWVEYLTFGGISPMADLRRRNGRNEPWRVRFWGVGNENWGCGGNMRPEYYADEYRRYQTYVRNFDGNEIYKIACGASDANYHWTDVLMQQAFGRRDRAMMHGLSLHYYTLGSAWNNKLPATGFGEDDWFAILRAALFMDELVTKHSEIMDRYDPDKQIGLLVDEWGTWYRPEPGSNPGFLVQQNSLRDALVAGVTLNIFNQHCDRVQMANIAQTINVLQAMAFTDGEKMALTPSYHVFDLYKVHHDATLLPSELACASYSLGDASLPALNASVSRSAGGPIHVTVCNLDPQREMPLTIDLPGMTPRQAVARTLTAAAMDAHNTFDQPDAVKPADLAGATIHGAAVTVTLPARSVTLLAIE